MMRRPFTLALLAIFLFSSCRRDEPVMPEPTTGTLRLVLVPEWEGQPMQRYLEYRNISNYRVTIELLKLHLSALQLVNADGVHEVAEVTYWDLVEGPVTQEWKLEKGTWTGFRAGLGVPSALNFADPAAYGPGHPLNVSNGTHWNWNTGYRFVMFEGRYDPDPLSTATLISSYAIHTGLDTCYRDLDLTPASPVAIEAGKTTTITVRFAVDRFFHSGDVIDLSIDNTAHGNNLPLALRFTDNVQAAITVE